MRKGKERTQTKKVKLLIFVGLDVIKMLKLEIYNLGAFIIV